MSAKARREARKAQKKLPTPVGEPVTDSDVLAAFWRAWPMGLTRRELAAALGRQVTPTLIGRIEKFVDSGHLEREIQVWPNKARGYKYTYVMTGDEVGKRSNDTLNEMLDKQP